MRHRWAEQISEAEAGCFAWLGRQVGDHLAPKWRIVSTEIPVRLRVCSWVNGMVATPGISCCSIITSRGALKNQGM